MAKQVPVVDYLALTDDGAHLQASVCDRCGARYLDRRNGCARCGGTQLHHARLADHGRLASFTIVQRAAPGVPVPFVAAIVELDDGAWVQSNLVDVEPDPEHVRLGMPLRLTTFVAGVDESGTEAVAFAFAPAS